MKNGVTAYELMKLKRFNSKVRLVTPTIALDLKPITHITIQEAPDLYEWVTGGEFVLTTWFAFSLEPQLEAKAVDKLFEKISAIGIKTHRFIDKIPDEVIDLAKKHNVPVFEIKKEVKFRELVTVISSQIQNYQTNLLLEVNDYYQELMNYSFDKNAKNLIINKLSDELRKNCLCMDYEYEIIAKKLIAKVAQKRLLKLKEQIKEYLKTNVDILKEFVIDDFHVFCCYAREKMIGFLIIESPQNLEEKDIIIIRQTSMFMAMHLWNVYYTRLEQSSRIWSNIISGKVSERWEIEDKLALLGIHLNQDFIISIFSKSNKYQNWFQYLNAHFRKKILLNSETEVVMFCGMEEFNYPFSILKNEFKEVFPNNLVVTSDVFSNVQNIRMHYSTTLHIFQLLKSLNMKGLYRVDDWLSSALLLSAKDSDEYRMVEQLILKPILEYDKKYNTCLFATLETAISTNSLEMTAKKLFVHINTIRYL